MKTRTMVIGVVLILIIAAYAVFFSHKTASVVVAQLATDVYPLYPGAAWGAEEPATYQEFSGYQIVSKTVPNVTDLSVIFQPFEQYYEQKLTALGWSVDNAQAAGGPGSEFVGYKKGSDEIIISYNSIFKGGGQNEPVQCPCDISMTIFSGTLATTTTKADTHADLIQVTSPLPNATLTSPTTIEGTARGSWYFEATFPVELVAADGTVLAQAPAQAQGDWMTTDFVPFKVTLPFTATGPATLILKKDNPSGLPANDDSIRVPVTLQ